MYPHKALSKNNLLAFGKETSFKADATNGQSNMLAQ
jgi:hypothetical protein